MPDISLTLSFMDFRKQLVSVFKHPNKFSEPEEMCILQFIVLTMSNNDKK